MNQTRRFGGGCGVPFMDAVSPLRHGFRLLSPHRPVRRVGGQIHADAQRSTQAQQAYKAAREVIERVKAQI